jgi:hypothetical protein
MRTMDRLYLMLLCLPALLVGCNYAPVTATPDAAATQSAAELEARMTEVIAAFTVTAAAGSPTPSPSPTVSPTATVSPTPVYTPTATLRPVLQDWARFVDDVSIPDGTKLQPGKNFTKTWRLMNIGLSTWTSDFSLVFVSGDRMSGRREIPLKGSVQPGYMVDVSVELTAPEDDGDYRGYWALMNPQGQEFGIGQSGRDSFWVDIEVDSPSKVAYDFVAHYCDAEWRSGAGVLPCPGELTDSEGFVIRLPEPPIEGHVEDEAGLWTEPEWVGSGYIRGTYPAFEVKGGDRFRALISCKADSPNCDLRFKLEYRIGDGSIETLDQWNERSDGNYTIVDYSLSSLAGKKVKFILTVLAKDEYSMDSAVWVAPSIWR